MNIAKLLVTLTMLTELIYELAIGRKFLDTAVANIRILDIVVFVDGDAGWFFELPRLTAFASPAGDEFAIGRK